MLEFISYKSVGSTGCGQITMAFTEKGEAGGDLSLLSVVL